MLLDFDGTLFVIAISFIIFAIIMHYSFYKPMRRVIEERDVFIVNNVNEARDLQNKAENILEDYKSKITQARLGAQERVENYTEKGKEERNKLISEARQLSEKELAAAKQMLDIEKDKAVHALKDDVGPLAQNIVSKVLGSSVSISGLDQDKIDKILRG
jgi:F-type H+-transporting ATPase subunit b